MTNASYALLGLTSVLATVCVLEAFGEPVREVQGPEQIASPGKVLLARCREESGLFVPERFPIRTDGTVEVGSWRGQAVGLTAAQILQNAMAQKPESLCSTGKLDQAFIVDGGREDVEISSWPLVDPEVTAAYESLISRADGEIRRRRKSYGTPEDRKAALEGMRRIIETVSERSGMGSTKGSRPLAPTMIEIRGGGFVMGSGSGPSLADPDDYMQEISISRFEFAEAEVSQADYVGVMGDYPEAARAEPAYCGSAGVDPEFPVVCLSWLEAVTFCNKLSISLGLQPVYAIDGAEVVWNEDKNGFRLPTEAEWEYAARVGGSERWVGTDDVEGACNFGNIRDRANFSDENVFPCDDGHKLLSPVRAGFEPNRFRLRGMGGNAAEWTWNAFADEREHSARPLVDPTGAMAGLERIIKGPSFLDGPTTARIGQRRRAQFSDTDRTVGLRLVRSLKTSRR